MNFKFSLRLEIRRVYKGLLKGLKKLFANCQGFPSIRLRQPPGGKNLVGVVRNQSVGPNMEGLIAPFASRKQMVPADRPLVSDPWQRSRALCEIAVVRGLVLPAKKGLMTPPSEGSFNEPACVSV